MDVFIPRKLDKAGKPLGFVRFRLDQVGNVESALNWLNDPWIGSYKLRVFLPRFDRCIIVSRLPALMKFKAGLSTRSPDKSFKDALNPIVGSSYIVVRNFPIDEQAMLSKVLLEFNSQASRRVARGVLDWSASMCFFLGGAW